MASFPGLPYRKQTPSLIPANIPFMGHTCSKSSCTFQSYQDPSSNGQQWAPTPTLCREEHQNSYYFMGQEPPAFVNLQKSHDGWVGGSRPASRIDTGGNHRRVSYPQTVNNSSPRMVSSYIGPNFYQAPQREILANTTSSYGSPRAVLINRATTLTVQPFYGSPRAATMRNGSYNSPCTSTAVLSNGARNQQRVYGTSPLSGTKGVKNSSYGQNGHTKLYRGGRGTKGYNKGNKIQRQHQ